MNTLFNGVYKGKTVLVTGHTGFKGSWLAFWLTKMGAKVIGFSLDIPTTPSHHELIDTGAVTIIGDIRDKEKILSVIREHQPEIIFHLAAQPIVRTSYEDPATTFDTNIMGTVNLLDAVRLNPSVKAVVCVTSDKCYENTEQLWGYRENDPMGGHDPYSASKGAAEIVAKAYIRSFFNPVSYGKTHNTLVATVRAGNVIGGGDWAKDRLIPDIIRATELNEEVRIRNPYATRPWQHVLEPLSGYLAVGEQLLTGETASSGAWNFGPGDHANLSVEEVLRASQLHWKKIRYSVETLTTQPHEAHLLHLDSTKARRKLKWKNVWDHNKAFERTITWYKAYSESGVIQSKSDLEDYVHDAKKLSAPWSN